MINLIKDKTVAVKDFYSIFSRRVINKYIQVKPKIEAAFNIVVYYLNKYSPFAKGIDDKKIKSIAYQWVEEITSPNAIFSNPYTPTDLRREQVRTVKSRSGKLLAGLVLPEDFSFGSDIGIKYIMLPIFLFLIATLNLLAISPTIIYAVTILSILSYKKLTGSNVLDTMFAGALMSSFTAMNAYNIYSIQNPLSIVLLMCIPALAIYIFNKRINKARAVRLLIQAKSHSSTPGIETNNTTDDLTKQIMKAISEDAKAPKIDLGITTGALNERGSSECPPARLPMAINILSLEQHMLVIGASGTGKSLQLKKIIKEVDKAYKKMNQKIGMLFLDGKGELGKECASISDVVIHPRFVEYFNFLDGLEATKFLEVFKTIANVKTDTANQEFAMAALGLIYNTALAHEYLKEINTSIPDKLPNFKYSFMYRFNLMAKLVDPQSGLIIADILNTHPNIETDPRIKQLIFDIEGELTEERQQFALKYLKTAQTYMQSVLQDKSIIKWADSEETSIDVLEVLKGKKVGVALPPEQYGMAGLLVTQLVKGKVRNAIANRETSGEANWRNDKEQTSVLIVQDEFQDLMNIDDENNIPKDRSRGCMNIVATQTISAILAKVSKREQGDQFINGCFTNIIAFRTDDKVTHEILQTKCGSVRPLRVMTKRGPAIAFRETAANISTLPQYDPTHPNADLFKKLRVEERFVNNYESQMKGKGLFNAFNGFTKTSSSIIENHHLSVYEYDEKQQYMKLLGDDTLDLLKKDGMALCYFKRGGAYTKDIVKMTGADNDFNDIVLADKV